MTGLELENISTELSNKAKIPVIFWYVYSFDKYGLDIPPEEEIREEDKTYYVVIRDATNPVDSKIYFRSYSDNWDKLYNTTQQILKIIGSYYEVN